MYGAIIGDIVGSRFEFNNHRSKDFELFTPECFFTDDSVMTLAVADALMKCRKYALPVGEQVVKSMREIGQHYPDCGYGGNFYEWMFGRINGPYNSFGNGAAMRVSACGWFATSIEDAANLAKAVTEVTHNHPEGIKGAQAVAVAIYMLGRKGNSQQFVKEYIKKRFYNIAFTLDEIRPTYEFNETCQETVPQAMEAFFEAKDFEDAIRNAISIGGDSDTVAAITGSLAEAHWRHLPKDLTMKADSYLDDRLKAILKKFRLTAFGRE